MILPVEVEGPGPNAPDLDLQEPSLDRFQRHLYQPLAAQAFRDK